MVSPKYIVALASITFIAMSLLAGCDRNQNSPAVSVASPEIARLKQAAAAGDAKAQFDLAKRFDSGDGVDASPTKSFDWFLKSAEVGNVEAMVEVAKRYSKGNGTRRDWEKSNAWWKKAAEKGNAEAQYNHSQRFGFLLGDRAVIMGQAAEEENYVKQYMEWLNKAASQNYPQAKYELGMVYLLGAERISVKKKLIQQEPEKGLPLIKGAADAGYWEAQWAMAVLYQSGFKQIKPDKEGSANYWKKFSEHTDPEIQRKIGYKYNATDPKWYKAGKNKYQGRALSFEDTNKIAFEWFQKAADKNDKFAIFALGQMYRDGRGVWKDDQKAIELFKKAADMGYYTAQGVLGFAYIDGKGVVKDYTEAYKWLLQAANEDDKSEWSGVHKIRNALGALHEFGWGAEKDLVIAYAWYNIAAAGNFEKAKQNLARVEKALKPDELREAQTLSREWKPGKLLVRTGIPKGNSSEMTSSSGKVMKLASVGTGFYVSPSGAILTNQHVIDGCAEIRVPVENAVAKLVVADPANDLAIVKLNVSDRTSLVFPDSDDLKQGEEVFVFGFPLDGYLPSAGNITPGIISALAGPDNNSSLIQMTAPVQPGNSGGPLLNKKGKVIGVVVGKADAIKIAKATGDIPQNINFSIAPRTVRSFLDGNRIEYRKTGDTFSFSKDSVAIAEEARKASVKIECWR